MTRARRLGVPIAFALVLVSACGEPTQPSRSLAAASSPPASQSPSSSAPPGSAEPSIPLAPDGEPLFETLPLDAFSDPTTIDNEWFPLEPGARFVFIGGVDGDEGRVRIRVTFTVTDLTKTIDGIPTRVVHIVDRTAGELAERELAFFAQDDDGNVWLMGEHPEEFEDGEFVVAPTWIAGLGDAKAGLAMRADPRPGEPSYSQGWGPAVEFTDRARVFETGSETCVPVGCYEDVVVIDEFNPEEPDVHQLKYYAPGVGEVRVGWAGALVEDHETLELVDLLTVPPADLDDVRGAALELEAHAYEISADVYGQTPPATRDAPA